MKNFIFIGKAGSGKGTQAVLLSEHLKIPHISMGDLLREKTKDNTKLGKEIGELIFKGIMVSDELAMKVLMERLQKNDCKKGFILDGFPRNMEQALLLDEMLKELETEIDKVFVIDVSNDIVLKRLYGRYSCKVCGAIYNKFFKQPKVEDKCDVCGSSNFDKRADDAKDDFIEKRLDYYEKKTTKVVDHYSGKGLIFLVNGVKDVETVSSEIKNAVK